MTDIALVWDRANGRADFAMNGTDILTDNGLRTAAIISLFADAQADPADVRPDNSDDLRGWWADLPLAGVAQTGKADRTGSKLWLLARELQTQETARRAEKYATDALAWMVADGVAGSVSASANFPRMGWIDLTVTIDQAGAAQTFNFSWSATP